MTPLSRGLINDSNLLSSSNINRAAALFPLFDLRKCDFILLFQNYWEWKRGIKINFNIFIRDHEGKEIFSSKKNLPKTINKISVKELCFNNSINLSKLLYGSIEIEIHSDENLYYPFPAIMGIYHSNNGYISTVHSAGRTTKKFKKEYFSETNFCTVFSENFKPFIHLFNGSEGKLDDLKIEIFLPNQKITANIPSLKKSYESKIIFIEDFFDICSIGNKLFAREKGSTDNKIELNDYYSISIKGKCESIFPRFIVGNYDLLNNCPWVTHSFREIIEEDNLEGLEGDKDASTIALPINDAKDIKLKLKIYPTASPNKTSIDFKFLDLFNLENIKSYNNKDLSLPEGVPIMEDINSKTNFGLGLIAKANKKQNKLPARIPINLSFSLKDYSSFHTDIALQLRTKFTKRKKNYWYNSFFSKDYKNIVLGSSFIGKSLNDNYDDSLKFNLHLNIEDIETNFTKVFSYKKNESRSFCININEIFGGFLDDMIDFNNLISYSWRIEMVLGEIQDLYCITYNKKINCIFGDHSF